jgi:energy-coupling factor transporter ATP-binding protein EcfA2
MRTWVYCERCSRKVAIEASPGQDARCPDCGHSLQLPDSHDVFVSYATPDIDVAKQICAALHARKLNYWFAPEMIKTGESFATRIDDDLSKSKVIVLVMSEEATKSPWVTNEITTAISAKQTVLPFKIQQFDLPAGWRIMLKQCQWRESYRGEIENEIGLLVTRVEESLRALSMATLVPPVATTAISIEKKAKQGVRPGSSPYVGPQPFTSQMAGKFFGRSHDAAEILKLIAQNRFVLIYAPSGAGKSSLLNTLVCNSLEEQGLEVLLGARVGGALPDGVKAVGIRNIFTFSVVYGLQGSTPSAKCQLRESLQMRHKRAGVRGRVIVFDQFEELFTQHAERFEDRKGFFDDVVAAMHADPDLRVVFAMRQEYLADIDPLLADLPADLSLQRFALRRIDLEGALEAIVGPAADFAEFAEGVAEDIVRQLNTIRVAGFDGVVVEKRGEFIEMVHLQIVCKRLWDALPEGITRIEREHVERAAGEGKSFGDFVVNALNVFYDDTVANVSQSKATAAAGGYTKELIQLGCMKFVTMSATRTMIERKNDRTGRLPNWIVDQLEKNHLLRMETRGGAQWYELSHDRLADPVARQLNRDVSKLLFASDLLEAVLNRVKEERPTGLTGYFGSHRDVLSECEPFHKQVGLFEDEAEFVFRASLAAGVDVVPWSRRLTLDFPEARHRVLTEAIVCPDPEVRANAAALLGDEFDESLSAELIGLAVGDSVAKVRKSAIQSLAKLDRPELFDAIKDQLASPATQANAKRAVAHLVVLADRGRTGPVFDRAYRSIGTGRRAGLRTQAWRMRLGDAVWVLPYVVIPAGVFSAIAAGLFKWVPGMFNYALCQARPSLMAGMFHGATAALVWGGLIPLFLMLHRVVFLQKSRVTSGLRPVSALVWGAVAGCITGFVVTMLIAGVFDTRSLETMGWISNESLKQNNGAFWNDLFFQTRYGWAYIITGCAMGVSMAVIGNGMRSSGKFDFAESGDSVQGRKEFFSIIRQMMKLAVRYLWAFPICLTISGVVVMMILNPGDKAAPEKRSFEGKLLGVIFDAGCQMTGGYFSMVGVGLGIVLMTRGVRVEPRKDEI